MSFNWRQWVATVGGAVIGAVAVNMVDPTVHSWNQMLLFGFWQKVVALLLTHGILAKADFRARDARTRAEDTSPLTLNLFEKKGDDK